MCKGSIRLLHIFVQSVNVKYISVYGRAHKILSSCRSCPAKQYGRVVE